MAHALSEEELIAALEAKGTYVVSKKPSATPLSAPPTLADHGFAPHPSMFNLTMPKFAPDKHGDNKFVLPPVGRGAQLFKASTPLNLHPPPVGRGQATTNNHTFNQGPIPSDFSQYAVAAAPPLQKIPLFSGDDLKGDVTYLEWRFEIRCLMHDSESSPPRLSQAIRGSLRGTARSVMVSLGENAPVDAILSKLDKLFGDVSTPGMVMQEFFSSYQRADESVTRFGCRLECLLRLALGSGQLDPNAMNCFLRHKFWTSLASEKLKSQTRHKYDEITDYDELIRQIRSVEREMEVSAAAQPTSKKAAHHPIVADSQISDLEKRFDSKLDCMEKRIDSKIDEKFGQILHKLNSLPSSVPAQGAQGQSNSNTHSNNTQSNSNHHNNKKRWNNSHNNKGNQNKGNNGNYSGNKNQGNHNTKPSQPSLNQ